MFFGICIYDQLNCNGELDSIIITPNEKHLVVDRLNEVGIKKDESVDIGSLRFYFEENNLDIKAIKSKLINPVFQISGDMIEFRIDHQHLPLTEGHAGYYLLLLPENFCGEIDCSSDNSEIYWLEDSKQVLISLTVYPHNPNISVSGNLRLDENPRPNMEITTMTKMFKGNLPGIHFQPVNSILKAMSHKITEKSPSVFICHSSENKSEARRLAIELATRGIKPWIDEAEIKIGDSLFDKIENGIKHSTCLIPILSKASVDSAWCKEELRMALAMQLTKKIKKVLPVLIENCEIPGFLLEKLYLDLRKWETYDLNIDKISNEVKELHNLK